MEVSCSPRPPGKSCDRPNCPCDKIPSPLVHPPIRLTISYPCPHSTTEPCDKCSPPRKIKPCKRHKSPETSCPKCCNTQSPCSIGLEGGCTKSSCDPPQLMCSVGLEGGCRKPCCCPSRPTCPVGFEGGCRRPCCCEPRPRCPPPCPKPFCCPPPPPPCPPTCQKPCCRPRPPCPPTCQKPCCRPRPPCPPTCQKPCCRPPPPCPPTCQKPCCRPPPPCPPTCQKPCCRPPPPCPPTCQKPCCRPRPPCPPTCQKPCCRPRPICPPSCKKSCCRPRPPCPPTCQKPCCVTPRPRCPPSCQRSCCSPCQPKVPCRKYRRRGCAGEDEYISPEELSEDGDASSNMNAKNRKMSGGYTRDMPEYEDLAEMLKLMNNYNEEQDTNYADPYSATETLMYYQRSPRRPHQENLTSGSCGCDQPKKKNDTCCRLTSPLPCQHKHFYMRSPPDIYGHFPAQQRFDIPIDLYSESEERFTCGGNEEDEPEDNSNSSRNKNWRSSSPVDRRNRRESLSSSPYWSSPTKSQDVKVSSGMEGDHEDDDEEDESVLSEGDQSSVYQEGKGTEEEPNQERTDKGRPYSPSDEEMRKDSKSKEPNLSNSEAKNKVRRCSTSDEENAKESQSKVGNTYSSNSKNLSGEVLPCSKFKETSERSVAKRPLHPRDQGPQPSVLDQMKKVQQLRSYQSSKPSQESQQRSASKQQSSPKSPSSQPTSPGMFTGSPTGRNVPYNSDSDSHLPSSPEEQKAYLKCIRRTNRAAAREEMFPATQDPHVPNTNYITLHSSQRHLDQRSQQWVTPPQKFLQETDYSAAGQKHQVDRRPSKDDDRSSDNDTTKSAGFSTMTYRIKLQPVRSEEENSDNQLSESSVSREKVAACSDDDNNSAK